MTPTTVMGMILLLSGLYVIVPATTIERRESKPVKDAMYGLGTILGVIGWIAVLAGGL